jgi:hypothetical protein
MTHDQRFKNPILDYPRQALSLFAAAEVMGLEDEDRDTSLAQAKAQAVAGALEVTNGQELRLPPWSHCRSLKNSSRLVAVRMRSDQRNRVSVSADIRRWRVSDANSSKG